MNELDHPVVKIHREVSHNFGTTCFAYCPNCGAENSIEDPNKHEIWGCHKCDTTFYFDGYEWMQRE